MKATKRMSKKLHTSDLSDGWAKTQETLSQAAAEQTAADIDLVNATRAKHAADARLNAAIARKTKAETRLAKLRADLGVEVSS